VETDIRDTVNKMMLIAEVARCYKFLFFMLCTMMYPTTNAKGNVIYPCRQMCEEMLRGCSESFDSLGIYMTCTWLHESTDPEDCYYRRVTCDAPVLPNNGYIVPSTTNNISFLAEQAVNISCHDGYQMAPPVKEMRCNWVGEWTPDIDCERVNTPYTNTNSKSDLVTGISIGSAVLLVIVITIITIVVIVIKRNNASNNNH
jgi:hypothetical protein